MTAAQATVLVDKRNAAAKPAQRRSWARLGTRQLTQLSDEELLALARAEAAGEGESPHQKQDLEVIALLSATNTAVTVMVLDSYTSLVDLVLVQPSPSRCTRLIHGVDFTNYRFHSPIA